MAIYSCDTYKHYKGNFVNMKEIKEELASKFGIDVVHILQTKNFQNVQIVLTLCSPSSLYSFLAGYQRLFVTPYISSVVILLLSGLWPFKLILEGNGCETLHPYYSPQFVSFVWITAILAIGSGLWSVGVAKILPISVLIHPTNSHSIIGQYIKQNEPVDVRICLMFELFTLIYFFVCRKL